MQLRKLSSYSLLRLHQLWSLPLRESKRDMLKIMHFPRRLLMDLPQTFPLGLIKRFLLETLRFSSIQKSSSLRALRQPRLRFQLNHQGFPQYRETTMCLLIQLFLPPLHLSASQVVMFRHQTALQSLQPLQPLLQQFRLPLPPVALQSPSAPLLAGDLPPTLSPLPFALPRILGAIPELLRLPLNRSSQRSAEIP